MKARVKTLKQDQYWYSSCGKWFDGYPVSVEVINVDESHTIWDGEYILADEVVTMYVYRCDDDPPCWFSSDPVDDGEISQYGAGDTVWTCGECGDIYSDATDAEECCL